MASDRTRELAKAKLLNKLSTAAALFAMEYNAAHEAGGYLNHGLDSVLKPIIDIALDAFEREARLDEAKDWLIIVENLLKHKKHDALANRAVSECRQRVEDLAAQPT